MSEAENEQIRHDFSWKIAPLFLKDFSIDLFSQ